MKKKETLSSINSIRRDIKNYLIHFTQDAGQKSAFTVLNDILEEKKLRGSSKLIKGSHKCVCFSEAPITEHISNFNLSKINPAIEIRYKPFGLLFKKDFLFKKGCRPVVYQPEEDYTLLGESLKYKHVTYEIGETDFTWEREWRIQTDELSFSFDDIHVLVPNHDYSSELFNEFSTTEAEFSFGMDGDEPVQDYVGHSSQYNLKVISLDVLGLDFD